MNIELWDNYEYEPPTDLVDGIKGKVLVVGTINLWNRAYERCILLDSFADCFSDSNWHLTFYYNNRGVFCREAHHDGTNYYRYYLVKHDDINRLKISLINYEKGTTELKSVIKQHCRSLRKELTKIFGRQKHELMEVSKIVCITITKSDGWYVINGRGTLEGIKRRYLNYTKKEAIKKFRQDFELVNKQLEIIEYQSEVRK